MKDTEGGGGKRRDNFALNPLGGKNGIIILPRTQGSEIGSTSLEKHAWAMG